MAKATVQEIRVGGGSFCVVPKQEYLRLLRDAGRLSVDAVEYATMSIGRSLRARREKAKLTQGEVATRAGIRIETLSRIENGRGNPTVATVRRILVALGDPEVAPKRRKSTRQPRRH